MNTLARLAFVVAALVFGGSVLACAENSGTAIHPVAVTPKQALDRTFCLQCHTDKSGKFAHSAITSDSCGSCHTFTAEGSETRVTLVASGRELCLRCHADKGTAHSKGTIHSPVKDDCTLCHDPHASEYKNLLKKTTAGSSKDHMCMPCHEESAPTPDGGSRHAVLDMGCEACHVTHKTGEPGKKEFDFHLTKSSPALCRDCHADSNPKIRAAHKDQPTANTDCTICHDPHQSRVAKLLHPNGHDPFVKKQCEKCHAPSQNEKVVLVEGGERALCYNCHEKMKAQVEQSKTKHPVPYLTETCSDCHDPHASRFPALLRKPEGDVCATCHDRSLLPVKHAPYSQGQCTACHDPHGANQPRLLRANENAVCSACHIVGQTDVKVEEKRVVLPWKAVIARVDFDRAPKIGLDASGQTGHPMVGHPISGLNRYATDKSALHCGSCHTAHTSHASGLLPEKVRDSIQLCETCHKD